MDSLICLVHAFAWVESSVNKLHPTVQWLFGGAAFFLFLSPKNAGRQPSRLDFPDFLQYGVRNAAEGWYWVEPSREETCTRCYEQPTVGHRELQGQIKPFCLFTWKEKPQCLTPEGLVGLWAASGLCITDTCEHTGPWMFHENTATSQQLTCSWKKTQVKKGYREHVGLGNGANTPENAIHSSEGQTSDWSNYRIQ